MGWYLRKLIISLFLTFSSITLVTLSTLRSNRGSTRFHVPQVCLQWLPHVHRKWVDQYPTQCQLLKTCQSFDWHVWACLRTEATAGRGSPDNCFQWRPRRRENPFLLCTVCGDANHNTMDHCYANHLCFFCHAVGHTRQERPCASAPAPVTPLSRNTAKQQEN